MLVFNVICLPFAPSFSPTQLSNASNNLFWGLLRDKEERGGERVGLGGGSLRDSKSQLVPKNT